MEERRSKNNRGDHERRVEGRRSKSNCYLIKIYSPLRPWKFAELFIKATDLHQPHVFSFGNDLRHPIHEEIRELFKNYHDKKLDIPSEGGII